MPSKKIFLETEVQSATDRSILALPRLFTADARKVKQMRAAVKAKHPVTTRVVTTIPEIEELRSLWTSFEGHRDGNLDFYLEYIQTSLNTLRPHVIVLYLDGQPRALLAGRLDLTEIDQRLGYWRIPSGRSRGLMFMGLRGAQSKEDCTALIGSLLQTLKDADADYAQIPTTYDSELYRAALELPDYLCRDHAPELSENHILRISGDFRHVHSQLSANLREQIRRKKKKIGADFRGRAEFVCYTQLQDLEKVIPHIEEVAQKSYQRALRVGFSNSEAMRRRLRFCATRGWLRVFVAYLEGRPAGFSIGTVCDKTYTSDFLGYDPRYAEYSVGTVLQAALIERCCEEGVRVIDFSAGDADYKRRFGNDCIKVARVYVFAPHFKGVYLNGVRATTANINKAGKYVLAKAGLLSKFKKALRIRTGSQPQASAITPDSQQTRKAKRLYS